MEHGPATEWKEEKSRAFKSRLGVILFIVYFAFYLAFILISVLNPKALGMDVGNLNLAIVYGFALIVIAIILAVVYNLMCSRSEKKDKEPEHQGDSTK